MQTATRDEMTAAWKMRYLGFWILLPAFLAAQILSVSGPVRGQDDLEALEEAAIEQAIAIAAPSVLRIETLGGLEAVNGKVVGVGPATGVIVSEQGHIISSAYRFANLPSSILVTLPSGKRTAAKIVARDHARMLVLLKVDPGDEKLLPARAAPRREMMVGQWTIALGKTFSADEANVSVGVISALNRIWGKAVQTDAKISPNNYGGPLIDIRGRAFGILAPLSPNNQNALAGTEWYDSGIGFAVPLEDIYRRLDHLKAGKDLKPGLLGVSLKGSDIYAMPAEIAAVRAKSPAREAGLKPGDFIVQINGKPVTRQAQLKHLLGPQYAGDVVDVVVERGKEKQRIESKIELAEVLLPYQHPFIGVLPLRETPDLGVVVRSVYPDSPAAAAGITIGDALVALNDKPFDNAKGLHDRLAEFEPGQTAILRWTHEGEERTADIKFAPLPENAPVDPPPPARLKVDAPPAETKTGLVEIKIPEEPNKCSAFVPKNYDPRVGYGLLVLLPPTRGFDAKSLEANWSDLCERYDLLVLAPQAGNARGWRSTEAEFVFKTIEHMIAAYNIDHSRIVMHGAQASGAMCYVTGFQKTELIRGIAAIDAPAPRNVNVPDNEPLHRLAIYSISAPKSRVAAGVKALEKKLRDSKFPVASIQLQKAGSLSPEEREDLVRWIDTLDRL